MKLTQSQEAASMHYQGPALVLAVPGAGKTTVLLTRVENLIKYHGVDPRKILSITFSKAQARDMKARFEARGGPAGPHFATIHSFAYDIVRAYASQEKVHLDLIEGSSGYNKYALVRRLYHQLTKTFIKDDSLEDFFTGYSFIKNSLISVDDYLEDFKPKIKSFKELIQAYENFKASKNLIDFDDMLTLALAILDDNEKILRRVQNAFHFIQVDEAQDTSKVQIELIKKIGQPKNNLFLVADDDQSIYAFRGSSPQDLLNFPQNYPDVKLFFMEENFRSSPDIIAVANRFISLNKERYDKTITAVKAEEEPVKLITCKNIQVQVDYLVQNISQDLEEGLSIAVLYRNNISGLPLMDRLKEEGIPFYNRDTSKAYLSHFVIYDVLNILKLAEDPSDVNLYEEVYYKLNAYLRKDYLGYLRNLPPSMTVFDGLLQIPGLKDYQREKIIDLAYSFDTIAKLKLAQAIDFIENTLGYGVYLDERTRKAGSEGYSPQLILEALKFISKGMDSAYQLEEKIELIKKDKATSPAPLTLSTIHSSKGLEFDSVYIIDLIEGEFPSAKSQEASTQTSQEALEEERRLFYVAMTRARKRLSLLTLKNRNSSPVPASQFFVQVKKMKKH